MPCYSTVTKTKMTDAERLMLAMRELGAGVIPSGSALEVSGGGMLFTRRREADGFETTSSDTERLRAIQKKYAELTVRAFAKRRGFAVAEAKGNQITLINRRGG